MKMRVLLLSRVDKEQANISTLKVGEHVIGRGPLLQCTSKKVSRNHGLVRVDQNNGVSLTSTHHNPCFYLSNASKHMTIVKNGMTVSVHNDDQIALLPDEYWFKVEIVDVVDETNDIIKDHNEIDNSLINNIEVNCNNKRENADSNESNSNKRRKSDNNDIDINQNAGNSNMHDQICDIELNLETNSNESLKKETNVEKPDSCPDSPDFLSAQYNLSHEVAGTSTTNVNTTVDESSNKDLTKETHAVSSNEIKVEISNVNAPVSQDLNEIDEENINILAELHESVNISNDELNSTGDNDYIVTEGTDELDEANLNVLSELHVDNTKVDTTKLSSDEIKSEPESQTDNEQQNIVTQRIDDLVQQNENNDNITVKQEPVDPESITSDVSDNRNMVDGVKIEKKDEDENEDVKVKVKDEPADPDDQQDGNSTADGNTTSGPQPSTSSSGRERCWYGGQCYRKNPQHKVQFSHPGDPDYGDVAVKPTCRFGAQCYRRNLKHRQQYTHPPPPKAGPAPNNTRVPTAKQDYESEPDEDEYDLEDPFLDDGSSDEYNMPLESSDSEDFDLNEDFDDENNDDVDMDQEDSENTKPKPKKTKKTKKKPTKRKKKDT